MSNKQSYIQAKVVELFKLDTGRVTGKGWIIGGTCPWCNRDDKFGIKLNTVSKEYRNHVSFNCFHGSCGERGSEYKLLHQIDKGHLLKHGDFIPQKNLVEKKIDSKIESELVVNEAETLPKPFGFRSVESDPYLEARGFESWQYPAYGIGRTKLDPKLKNYVLFSVIENGNFKGYVGRLVWSKSQISEYESRTGLTASKYKNEGGALFGELVYGIDEIVPNTEEVILVEGVTDKANVDRKLKLNLSDKQKCCCTFGKKISETQIIKLFNKGVERIVLLYDPDAIKQSETYSYLLQLWDIDVKVGYLSDKDPGELSLSELVDVLSETQSPNQFSVDKVQKRNLI
ncbi:MAG: hypothetical protein KUG81_08620 [Gammaproteobacteria bacterium]|nr:hypothetical protein [Gammaproteobacteria bacterium]